MIVLWWGFVAVAVLGAIFVSILRWVREGHWLWLLSNTGMLLLNIYRGTWAEVVLWSVYLVIAVIGLYRWGAFQKQRFGDDNERAQGR